MPIVNSGDACAAAQETARNAVVQAWRQVALDRGGPLSADEQAEMAHEVKAAELNALFAHMAAQAVVAVPATGLVAPPGTAGGPVAGAASGTIG